MMGFSRSFTNRFAAAAVFVALACLPLAAQNAPTFSATGVTNGISFAPPLAPGMAATISGANLADAQATCAPPLPTTCGGVTVLINGKAAPINFVSSSQINFQVPYDVTGTTVTVQTTRQSGSQTLMSTVVTAALALANPACGKAGFDANAIGLFFFGGHLLTASTPVQPGDVVTAGNCTGFGVTKTPVAAGVVPTGTVEFANVTATVGGVTATVQSATLQTVGNSVGLAQVVFKVPSGVAAGNQPFVVNVGSAASPSILLPVSAPKVVISSVVNQASFATGPVAPGELAALVGSNLADTLAQCGSGFPLPTICGGVTVLVNGKAAPVTFVSATQINFQIPYEVGSSAAIEVSRQSGGQTLSGTITAPVAPTAPGCSTFTSGGNTFGAFLAANNTIITPAAPANAGDTIYTYCTGFGAPKTPVATGAGATGLIEFVAPVTVTVGGQPAQLVTAVLAPGFAGFAQVVFKVPTGLSGPQPFVVKVGGVDSPPTQLPLTVSVMTVDGVSNNATGTAGISSGTWVSIYGKNFTTTPARIWRDSDFSGSNLPLSLDGVSVKINNKSAAVYYISPTLLNVLAPTDTATGPVQVQVTSGQLTATGTATLQQPYSPGFFPVLTKYPAGVHTDGAYLAPTGAFGSVVTSRPAQPGETILLFGTGFGPTTPAVPANQVVSGAPPLVDPTQLHVRIGGVPATAVAALVYAGEYQINVVIPPLPDGEQPIVADIGGVSTPTGIVIPIKN
jgi:uncharacterized protein (TIGR03437 family)